MSHPSILSIYELVVIDGVPVAVMELLEGETLRARLAHGALEWREAVRIGGAIAERPRGRARQGRGPPRPEAGERVPHVRRRW